MINRVVEIDENKKISKAEKKQPLSTSVEKSLAASKVFVDTDRNDAKKPKVKVSKTDSSKQISSQNSARNSTQIPTRNPAQNPAQNPIQNPTQNPTQKPKENGNSLQEEMLTNGFRPKKTSHTIKPSSSSKKMKKVKNSPIIENFDSTPAKQIEIDSKRSKKSTSKHVDLSMEAHVEGIENLLLNPAVRDFLWQLGVSEVEFRSTEPVDIVRQCFYSQMVRKYMDDVEDEHEMRGGVEGGGPDFLESDGGPMPDGNPEFDLYTVVCRMPNID